MTRKAVPLDDDDLVAIDAARTGGILAELAGEDAARSEASALHALVILGLRAVRERQELHGYAAMAANLDDEDRAYYAAMRTRRRGGE